MDELMNKYSLGIRCYIPDARTFNDSVLNTRNFFTHFDSSLRGKELRGRDLDIITLQLQVLLEACLLSLLPIDSHEAAMLISKCDDYRSLELEVSKA